MIENSFYINNGYKLINTDRIEYKNLASGTTLFPNNIRPQNTYGDVYMTKQYKPLSIISKLLVTVIVSISSQTGTTKGACALFVDSNLYSEGGGISVISITNSTKIIPFNSEIQNTNGNQITLYVRAGGDGGGVTFNQRLANNTVSSITIKEYIKL